MKKRLFLSHDSRDQERAQAIAHAISRITLGQISVWHSSDSAGSGGLKPGQVWLDEIRGRLAESRAVVVLLTPTSISRPWLLFESGFGAANPSCDVIPVCIGIDRVSEIPFPLAMYQAYQLSDYESLKGFTQKLLVKYEIVFDEEMAKPVLLEAIREITHAEGESTAPDLPRASHTLAQAVADLKTHIDKRLVGFATAHSSTEDAAWDVARYDVPINLNLEPSRSAFQFLEVSEGTSVQDILDNVYFMLEGEVAAYKYMEQWILREVETDINLVIREIQGRVPASLVFAHGSEWEVVWLKKPYSAGGSLAAHTGPRKRRRSGT